METDDDGEPEERRGDETMNGQQGSQSLLMKNIMRLVVVGSVIAIAINIMMLLG